MFNPDHIECLEKTYSLITGKSGNNVKYQAN